MYKEILEGLFDQNRITSEDEKNSYLKSLQNSALYLWKSYRNNYFNVDYSSRNTQEAYVIRYFPSYSDLIYPELKAKHTVIKFTGTKINCSLFGAGPCPEVYGVIKFIKEFHIQTEKLNFISFDKISKQWENTRNITINNLIRPNWEATNLKINNCYFDLIYPISSYNVGSLKSFNKLMGNSTLIVFQNFLNEINLRKNNINVYYNIVHIYNHLSKGALMIFIEVSGYNIEVSNLLINIQENIQRLNLKYILELFCSSDPIFKNSNIAPPLITKDYKANALNLNIPEILQSNFFNNNLFPKNIIGYESLILRR